MDEFLRKLAPEKTGKPKWMPAFLTALSQTGNVTSSCEKAGITRTHAYDVRQVDPEFAAAWQNALEIATDALEQEARRRAHEGLKRYRFTKSGQPILDPETGQPYFEHEYSDTLLIFLLKAHRPEKYRERYEHQVTGNGPAGEIQTKATVTHEIRTPAETVHAVLGILAEIGALSVQPAEAVPNSEGDGLLPV